MTIPVRIPPNETPGIADIHSIGEQLRIARDAVGYSVEQLAIACGLSHAEIVAAEEGSDTDPGRLRRICAALKLDLATLLPVSG